MNFYVHSFSIGFKMQLLFLSLTLETKTCNELNTYFPVFNYFLCLTPQWNAYIQCSVNGHDV